MAAPKLAVLSLKTVFLSSHHEVYQRVVGRRPEPQNSTTIKPMMITVYALRT